MKIAVLTGGGDCPGLNAAIRAVVRRSLAYDWEVAGVLNGWAGLLGEGNLRPMTADSVSGILHLGGTILGTSRTNPLKKDEHMQEVAANFRRHNLDALVAIGGDDTLTVASRLHDLGLPTVGVPKTMDNDVSGTDYCIGFNSAVTTVTDALDKLHTTASAHHRVLVVEVMGRHAGWVAVAGGLAGGADFIMTPEEEVSVDEVVAHLHNRRQRGKDFSIIVVSEGCKLTGIQEHEVREVDAFGHIRLDRREIGEVVAAEIERRTGFETRVTVLGHLQRGGSPSVLDRINATRLGVAAIEYVREGRFGYMPGLVGNRIVPVLMKEAVNTTKMVDKELYELAKMFY